MICQAVSGLQSGSMYIDGDDDNNVSACVFYRL